MTTVFAKSIAGRSLVSESLFRRLAARIVAEEAVERSLAERIMDQALAFLKACAENPGSPLAPSKLVDIGWHTFILYTREYAAFCDLYAGRFIHHVPTDNEPVSGVAPRDSLSRTTVAIREAGCLVDRELWLTGNAAKCNTDKCHGCQSGCHDDPPPIPPFK